MVDVFDLIHALIDEDLIFTFMDWMLIKSGWSLLFFKIYY